MFVWPSITFINLFLLLYDVPLYDCIIMSLFIVLLMDIQRFNFFCHAAILSVALFMCPLTYVQEFLYSVYLGIESLLCGSAQLFFYSVLPNCFPDWLYWLIVPPTGRESSLYLSPLGFTFLNCWKKMQKFTVSHVMSKIPI